MSFKYDVCRVGYVMRVLWIISFLGFWTWYEERRLLHLFNIFSK